ncbi:MAG: hypothetical protein KIS61_09405 [Candidatus Eremiobacteraeota bacterium]|nr:hypothetical protein [Candidatus Eremiobacteraeota bacterium]
MAGFKSLKMSDRLALAKYLKDKFSGFWRTVPGLYETEKGRPMVGGAVGLWFPCRDLQGQIQAIRIRSDEPKDPGQRYSWLSSKSHGGPTPGSPQSFWRPLHSAPDVVRLCEGEIKSFLAAKWTDISTISGGAGIGSLGRQPIIDWLGMLGATEVRLAPDADARTNPQVGKDVRRVVGQLEAAARILGFKLVVESWAGEAKGIDDALFAKVQIDLLTSQEYLKTLPAAGSKDIQGAAPAVKSAQQRKADRDENKEPTQVEKLLDLARDWDLLVYDGQPYASVVTCNPNGTTRRDTLRFSRTGARKKLQHLYHLEYGTPPAAEALTAVMGNLEAKAEFEGVHARVWLRTAYENGKAYLDLADEQGRVAVVSAEGWEVVANPPVYFQRTKGMLPIPEPVRGGELAELDQFVNLDPSGRILCLAWVLHALFPEYPHAILLLEGGQGCGKSSLARMLRSLFDPHAVPFRKAPKDDEDLAVAAGNNWAVVYDNLSKIPGLISDALCGLATGSGHARRALYSDDEESAYSYLRPVILTGLPGLSGKSDLAERILKIELPAIPEDSRKLESELVGNGDWEAARPRILGALLDAVSCSLRNGGKKRLQKLPRMADFAQFVVNAEDALPFSGSEFLQAFEDSRRDQVEGMLEADPVASAVRRLMDHHTVWEDCMQELSNRLSVGKGVNRNARALSVRIRLAEANLRTVGIHISFSRAAKGKRLIRIERTAPSDSASVEAQTEGLI